MIKVETEKGDITLEVRGNLVEILADLTTIIKSIHEKLPDELGETFLNCISECIPKLCKNADHMEEEEESESEKALEEAAKIATALLRWRDGDDFNLPD